MPSVRDRINAFEAKGKMENDDLILENGKGLRKRGQRFLFPGSSKAGKQDGGSSHALEQWPCPPSGSASRVTPTFEAGLEEVWSVRKNIGTGVGTTQGGRRVGVGGGMVGGQLNCGKTSQQGVFSRHNPMSMAAQPAASHGRSIGAARSTTLMQKNSVPTFQPLRDRNVSAESGKRRLDSPMKDISPPQAKRKTFNALGLLPDSSAERGNKRLTYAEKMAVAHRKSAGLGEFAPEDTNYVKVRDGKAGASSKWTQPDSSSNDDEFDF